MKFRDLTSGFYFGALPSVREALGASGKHAESIEVCANCGRHFEHLCVPCDTTRREREAVVRVLLPLRAAVLRRGR